MRKHSPRTVLDFTGLMMLMFAYLTAFHQGGSRSEYLIAEAAAVVPADRTSPAYSPSAVAGPLRACVRSASQAAHCPTGCHDGVNPGHLHMH